MILKFETFSFDNADSALQATRIFQCNLLSKSKPCVIDVEATGRKRRTSQTGFLGLWPRILVCNTVSFNLIFLKKNHIIQPLNGLHVFERLFTVRRHQMVDAHIFSTSNPIMRLFFSIPTGSAADEIPSDRIRY